MNRAVLLVSLAALFLFPNLAQATKFAILLGEPPQPDAPPASIKNPLYEDSGHSGTNPMHEARSLHVNLVDAWPGEPATLQLALDDDLPSDLPALPQGALAFEVSLIDAGGLPIHHLPDPLQIFFDVDAPAGALFEFGTLNEADGTWQAIETMARRDDGLWCGTTDHLSYFYIAPVPEPSSWLLGSLAACGCWWLRRRIL
jgi:hypothetical protein